MASTKENEVLPTTGTSGGDTNGTTTTSTCSDDQKICDACGKPGENLLACARCKQAWYHNKKCQVDHFPHHKAKCKQLVAAMKAQQQATQTPNNPLFEIATVDTPGQQTLAEGVQVIDTEDLGKACIATQSFSSGDTVLLEPPAIVFDERSGYKGLFEAYLKASPTTQQKMLQMYRPKEDALAQFMDDKRKKIRTKRKQLLVQQYGQFIQANPQHKQALPLPLADQLIGLVDANAHAFQANHTVDIVATSTNNAVPHTYHAIFTLGSRVEHSCSPNLTFVTKGGKLEYLAEIAIAPQERLSISYLGSVYERPRKQRQGFLRENKTFLCKCTRCMGWDECSPLRCHDCSGGVLLHSGAREQWECQQCDKTVSSSSTDDNDTVSQQLRGEADLHAKIKRFQYILQSQPYPEMLDEILEVVRKPKWTKILHPLHWLNVEAYKLISSVATSAARYYYNKENNHKNGKQSKASSSRQSEKAPSLLRLSALSTLRRILWTGRIAAINRGLMTVQEALENAATENFILFSPHSTRLTDVETVVKDLCDNPRQQHELGCTLGVSPAFHAGQDLIVAGHKELAWKLYKRFETSFENWKGLSDASRANIKVFLDSNGEDNPFENFLLQ
ncbi:SET domain [Seminavis robusta]|uniref:SET domain n=1 Tax=Seminavis robusta TaxID=568900 RepID=A0A9N8DMK8_9STRA|nr:SET domain [Seminavis robusta]|eukprot:Sro216_g089370.1 SET domain (618) ;mRNA; f:40421-42274